MGNSFFTSNRIGKMKAVGASGKINGSPDVKAAKRSDYFYTSAKTSSAPVRTTGGIPGGKSKTSMDQEKGKSIDIKGSSNVRNGGHSRIAPTIKNGG